MTEHGYSGLYLDQAAFGYRQVDCARQKESRQGLHMPAAQSTMWPENGRNKRGRVRRPVILSFNS
jgi:hypothetical protein